MKQRQLWVYRGYNIYPAGFNTSGLRWYAHDKNGYLRSVTKQGMRQLINKDLQK